MSNLSSGLGQANRKRIVTEAEYLQTLGFNVVPLLKGKRPFLRKGELKGFFNRRSNPTDIQTWMDRSKDSKAKNSDWRWENLGSVTGHTSGFFSLDTDSKEAEEHVKRWGAPRTWCVATGRGLQRHYCIPTGLVIPTKTGMLPNIDIKGEKGIAVLPPSVHKSAKEYEWINHPSSTLLASAPEWLINTIRLCTGDDLSEKEYKALPDEIIKLLQEQGSQSSYSGSGKIKLATNPLSDEIPDGVRNNTLFKKAAYYRHLGYEEEELLEKLSLDNQVFCTDPLEEEEVENIVGKVCSNYSKGDPAPLKVQEAIELLDTYYTQHPPKKRTDYTDKDIEEAFLKECLSHCSVHQDGIELSISYGQLADKANISENTLKKALKERLIPSGKIKKGKRPKGTKSGTLILIPSIYSVLPHSFSVTIPYGMSGPKLHKSPVDGIQSRWGAGKMGKSRNHLLGRILEFVPDEETFTPRYLTDKINEQVTEENKKVLSTSLSRHLGTLCEWEILERVRHGVYRLNEDWARNLGLFMRDSGEFESILKQRRRYKEKQESYRNHLAEVRSRRDQGVKNPNQWEENKKRAEEENRKQTRALKFLEDLNGEYKEMETGEYDH